MSEPPNPPVGIDTANDRLWRNVHPTWVDGERLSSQAFRPTAKDADKLSVAWSQKVSPEEHFIEFTGSLALQSAGVWALLVAETKGQGLETFYDAESDVAPPRCPTGHAYIDFSHLGSAAARRAGAALRDAAQARGRIHPPT